MKEIKKQNNAPACTNRLLIREPIHNKQETKPAIFQRSNKWYVTLAHESDDAIEIPNRMGKIIYAAFKLQDAFFKLRKLHNENRTPVYNSRHDILRYKTR